MTKRYFSIFALFNVFLAVFLSFYIYFASRVISPADVQGHFIQKGKWDNFGIIVNLYRGKELLGQELTALNGYFEFRELKRGDYQLYFFDGQYFLAKKNVRFDGKPLVEKYVFTDRYYHPLFLLESFGFILALILCGLSFLLLFRSRQKQFVWLVWLMMMTVVLFSGVEFIQVVLAKFGQEILAGTIFPFKHLGLTWFGLAFLSLLLVFPRPSVLLSKIYPFWSLALAGAFIVLSWIYFGSDQVFQTVWKFSFGQLRALIISQFVVFLILGLWRLIHVYRREKDIFLKNKLQILLFGVGLFLAVMVTLVFIPLIFWQGQEFFPGQYNTTAVFSACFLLGFVVYAVSSYRVLSFQQLLNRSVTYFIVTSLLVCGYAFLIVYLDKALINFSNYLLNVYIMAFFIALFVPLRSRIQLLVEKYFFGDQQAQRAALSIVARQILRCVDSNDILLLLRRNLQKYLGARNVFVEIFFAPKNRYGKNYFLPEDKNWPALKNNDRYNLAVPIQDKQAYGLIFLTEKKTFAEYTESELDLLLAVASQAAIALANIQLYRQMLSARQEIERSQRLASLGTLAAGLAHEIKNPLAALSNMAALLPERHNDKKFLRSFNEIVPRQIQRMNVLVGNMLGFAKSGSEKFTKVELSAVLQRTTELLKATARRQKVELTAHLLQKCSIEGNDKALEQVFLNLGLNAIEAMPKGGKLTFRLLRDGKKVVVEIEDTGSGIEKNDLENIFDPFFTTKPGGTGLGLSITYHILEQHKAKIKVDSRKGEGTKFTIEF